MKACFALWLIVSWSISAMGAPRVFYLGTSTASHRSQGIYAGTLDTETGKLGPISLVAAANNPGYLAISADGQFVYAALEANGGAVGAFRVENGKLAALNVQSTGGAGACHVSLVAHGHAALAANYGGGSIAVLPIKPDGSLGERTASVSFTGSGPDETRQKAPHAHSIYSDETGRLIYSCDLGTDSVWIFHLDPANGSLTPATPPAAKVPPGGGPRHLAWLPGGRFAYVNNEMALSVTAFAREGDGSLTPFQTVSSLPAGVLPKGNTSAEIVCHPSGRWLYVSNRYHDSITGFAVAADGHLSWLENVPAGVKVPRGFGIDPSGRWMIVGGQDDNRIVVFKIDENAGRLTQTDQTAEVGSPICVAFAPGPEGASRLP